MPPGRIRTDSIFNSDPPLSPFLHRLTSFMFLPEPGVYVAVQLESPSGCPNKGGGLFTGLQKGFSAPTKQRLLDPEPYKLRRRNKDFHC